RVRARAEGSGRAGQDEERGADAASRQRRVRGARADGEHRGGQYPRDPRRKAAAELRQSGGASGVSRGGTALRVWSDIMARPLIAVTDSVFPSLDPAMAALKRVDPEIRMAKSGSTDDILAVARDADAILVTYAKLPGDLLRQLKRCKAIGRFGLGVDNIDIPAATECGITVTYVPDYCLHEVSDHAMAMLLALVRKIPLSDRLVQSGRWEMPAVVPIRRLHGQVLGLVGFGNIPRMVAPKA